MAYSWGTFPLILLFFIRLLSILPCFSSNNLCDEQCGGLSIPYPFYLNNGCGLPGFNLHCINFALEIRLGSENYKVSTISEDGIVIDLLGCSRSVRTFQFRGNNHYMVSPENILQLVGCKSFALCDLDCNIPVNLNQKQCIYDGPCCVYLSNTTVWHAGDSIAEFDRLGCSNFSSWAVSRFTLSQLDADYGLKLEWAVPGNCSSVKCSSNAKCVKASSIKGGVRCQCERGYTGDGFADGVGCLKECQTQDDRKTLDKSCESDSVVSKIYILVAGIVAAATVVGGLIIAFALPRRHRSRSQEIKRQGEAKQFVNFHSLHSKACTMKLFSYKELERATKGFAASKKLGDGSCGTVYAGKLSDGSPVAVKRIHFGSVQATHQFFNEINVLSAVRHRNLVYLHGCCIEDESPILVYEFVPNGTLTEHLQRKRGEGLNWQTRLTVATETANAIAYLHTAVNPPIYHCDVKSSNILLDYDYTAKVGDFGLSRLVFTEGSHISTIPQGTPGYLDPEYHVNFHLSDKSDVYSFGVVLVELITGMKVVDFSRDRNHISLAPFALSKMNRNQLDDIIDPFLEVQEQSLLREQVYRIAKVAFQCLSFEKDARPTMMEVTEQLAHIQKDDRHTRISLLQENCKISLDDWINDANKSTNSITVSQTNEDSSSSDNSPHSSGYH